MKNIVTCLVSAAFALAMSSCAQMQPTSSKSKSPTNSTYGSTQANSSQQGANPYGYGNDPAYNQYQQQPAYQYSNEGDFVSVTPAQPQYTNTSSQAPLIPSQVQQYGNTAPQQPQYANTAPQYQAPAAPPTQMGSYQDAAQPYPPASYQPQAAQPAPGTIAQTHVVQQGETLYRISKMYGSSVDGIKGVNGLNSNLIRPGDVLSIP